MDEEGEVSGDGVSPPYEQVAPRALGNIRDAIVAFFSEFVRFTALLDIKLLFIS